MTLHAHPDITALIGHTPLVRLNRLSPAGGAAIYAKVESLNPGGSVKDRICLNMIDDAERSGRLKPGATIVEPTSGNTGIGLSLVAAVRGYQVILVMPDSMSVERVSLLSSYGATLVLTPGWESMRGCIKEAERIVAQHPSYFMPDQFSNPANPDIQISIGRERLSKSGMRWQGSSTPSLQESGPEGPSPAAEKSSRIGVPTSKSLQWNQADHRSSPAETPVLTRSRASELGSSPKS